MQLAVALPFAVAFGAGGLAIAASAVASKGRNALMTIYIAEVLLLLLPLLGMIPGMVASRPGWARSTRSRPPRH